MTTKTIPCIAARNIDEQFDGRDGVVAGNISQADDRKHCLEPGIGEVVTLVGGDARKHTGEVIDRWLARDDDGNFSAEVVIDTTTPAAKAAAAKVAAADAANRAEVNWSKHRQGRKVVHTAAVEGFAATLYRTALGDYYYRVLQNGEVVAQETCSDYHSSASVNLDNARITAARKLRTLAADAALAA